MRRSVEHFLVRVFIPKYDSLSLFLMGMAIVLIFFLYAEVRQDLYWYLFEKFSPITFFIGVPVFVLGLLFSLAHVFIRRPKLDFEKRCMLLFAVVVNMLSAGAAGFHMLEHEPGLPLVVPLWNLANAAGLGILLQTEAIGVDNILDDDASLIEVVFGALAVIIVLLVCRNVYELHWAIAFSVCVIWASNLGLPFGRLFIRTHKSSEAD